MEGIISSKSDRNSKRDNYSNGNGSNNSKYKRKFVIITRFCQFSAFFL